MSEVGESMREVIWLDWYASEGIEFHEVDRGWFYVNPDGGVVTNDPEGGRDTQCVRISTYAFLVNKENDFKCVKSMRFYLEAIERKAYWDQLVDFDCKTPEGARCNNLPRETMESTINGVAKLHFYRRMAWTREEYPDNENVLGDNTFQTIATVVKYRSRFGFWVVPANEV
jgi:hypothetical protein